MPAEAINLYQLPSEIVDAEHVRELPMQARWRKPLLVIGLFFWIGVTIFNTSLQSAAWAFFTNALFVAVVALLCTSTRTVSLRTLARMFMFGSFMLAVTILLSEIAFAALPPLRTTWRQTFHPPLEEIMKLLPLLIYLWRARRLRLWTLGASDVLSIGCALGAGFAFIEDAHLGIHASFKAEHALAWLPVARIGGYDQIIAGHAIWTGITAGAIGIALMLRSRRTVWIACLGLALWPSLDHSIGNIVSGSGRNGAALLMLTGKGDISIILLIAIVATSIWVDRKAIARISKQPECRAPHGKQAPFLTKYFKFDLRRLAYAFFRFDNETTSAGRAPFIPAAMSWLQLVRSYQLAKSDGPGSASQSA
jgi:RsiW-degrading membrane proteinase PrsW (M82 family)